MRGLLVFSSKENLNVGYNYLNITYGDLPNGMYLITVKGESINTTRKLSIQ